jgi:hypothetical protein
VRGQRRSGAFQRARHRLLGDVQATSSCRSRRSVRYLVEVGELTELNAPRTSAPSPEHQMTLLNCTTTVYIGGTPQQVWRALTDAAQSAAWWTHHNVSTWSTGDPWSHDRIDGSGIADITGIVVEAHPPTRLELTWG